MQISEPGLQEGFRQRTTAPSQIPRNITVPGLPVVSNCITHYLTRFLPIDRFLRNECLRKSTDSSPHARNPANCPGPQRTTQSLCFFVVQTERTQCGNRLDEVVFVTTLFPHFMLFLKLVNIDAVLICDVLQYELSRISSQAVQRVIR
jgi:hypothetical protein